MNGTRPRGRRLFVTGLLLVVIGLMPLASALLASTIADAAGCRLDEASVHQCIVAGVDIGDTLATMFVLGWLTLATIWLVPIGMVLLAIAGWRGLGRAGKRRRAAQ